MSDRQATALAKTDAVAPEIARLRGIALAGVFQIIITEAGRRTREGQSQNQIADELRPAIERFSTTSTLGLSQRVAGERFAVSRPGYRPGRGLAHTASDQSIHVDGRVLFTGDLPETRSFPIVPYFPPFDTDVDVAGRITVLGQFLAPDPAVVVPGHGEVTGPTAIRDVRDYLDYIRRQTAQLRADGASPDDAGGRDRKRRPRPWTTWDARHRPPPRHRSGSRRIAAGTCRAEPPARSLRVPSPVRFSDS